MFWTLLGVLRSLEYLLPFYLIHYIDLIPYDTRTCIDTSFPNIYDLISFPLEALGDVEGNLERRTNNLRGPHNPPYNPRYAIDTAAEQRSSP
jgi:hypothetical protein